MSNRDGKHCKNNFRKGQICKKCGKSKLESLFKKYLQCKKCGFNNY